MRGLIAIGLIFTAVPAMAQHAHNPVTHAAPADMPPVALPPAAAFEGPEHAADRIFGAEAMRPSRELARREHGDIRTGAVMIDQLEAVIGQDGDGYNWHVQGWYGGDIDRLWIKARNKDIDAKRIELQALWHHALGPWWNLRAGLRQDLGAGPDRTHVALGLQGIAPYWIRLDGELFLSNKGDVTARIEAEYDQRLTQKLILQPRVELDLSAQNVPELAVGHGLSSAEFGLRLRYEFIPEFAPYIGVEHERSFGQTAAYVRTTGRKTSSWNLVIGIRAWF